MPKKKGENSLRGKERVQPHLKRILADVTASAARKTEAARLLAALNYYEIDRDFALAILTGKHPDTPKEEVKEPEPEVKTPDRY